MKKFVLSITWIQLILLFSVPVSAQFQPTEVVRSQEKTLVDGKIYYIHTVIKGQTAYSISKAYEVTLDELKAANPGIDILHLAEGLALRIPDNRSKQAVAYPQNKEDFIAHVVRKKDTVYSLAKKYKIDEEVIYHYNPWAREGIKQDQTLWIPKNKEISVFQEPAVANDQFFLYTVKEKDTLYSIARSFGVDIAEIFNTNPELRNGLKPGQVLRIKKPTTVDPLYPSDSVLVAEMPCTSPLYPETYHVALLLPLYASFNIDDMAAPDSLAEEGTVIPMQRQMGLRGRNFAEFYEGFMLALDSLKGTGLSVNLQVFDTERDTNRIKKYMRELAPLNPDLIIGPVFSNDVNIAGRMARNKDFFVVSPLSARPVLVNNNPNIIQIIPPRQAESYALANYLRTFKQGKIILIRDMDSVSTNNSLRFKNYITSHMPVNESGLPLHFVSVRLNDSLYQNLSKILSKEEDNLVVVFSDNEAMVNILVSRLIQRSSMYTIQLFGMPSWQTWTNIDLSFFHSLQLHVITPFYTDYSNPAVKKFLAKSRAVYGYEPFEIGPLGYNFSMLGYDIGSYFLSALQQYGKNFRSCINEVSANQLLTHFHFRKTLQGGFVNNSFSVVLYKSDFSVERVAIVKGESEFPPVVPVISPTPGDIVPLPLPLP